VGGVDPVGASLLAALHDVAGDRRATVALRLVPFQIGVVLAPVGESGLSGSIGLVWKKIPKIF